MTAAQPGELREVLAEAIAVALNAAYDYSSYRWPQQQDCPRIADELLPVVTAYAERVARERAAEELESAADELAWHSLILDMEVVPAGSLRARAAALTADDQPVQP